MLGQESQREALGESEISARKVRDRHYERQREALGESERGTRRVRDKR